MLTPVTAVGGVNSKLVCRDKDVFFLKENIVVHASLPDLTRTIVLAPSNLPCSVTSFDVVESMLAVAFRTVSGPHVEFHKLSASHASIGMSSFIENTGGVEICDIAFSGNGAWLAVLSSLPDFSVKVYNTETKECLHSVNLVIPASRISFSPNSSAEVLVHGSGIAQLINFAVAPPSVLRCEFVDGQQPISAHCACFGEPPCSLLLPSLLLRAFLP
jgi:hypothetical protein